MTCLQDRVSQNKNSRWHACHIHTQKHTHTHTLNKSSGLALGHSRIFSSYRNYPQVRIQNEFNEYKRWQKPRSNAKMEESIDVQVKEEGMITPRQSERNHYIEHA